MLCTLTNQHQEAIFLGAYYYVVFHRLLFSRVVIFTLLYDHIYHTVVWIIPCLIGFYALCWSFLNFHPTSPHSWCLYFAHLSLAAVYVHIILSPRVHSHIFPESLNMWEFLSVAFIQKEEIGRCFNLGFALLKGPWDEDLGVSNLLWNYSQETAVRKQGETKKMEKQ